MIPTPPRAATQAVKLDKLMAPIYCGPGKIEIETKKFRYVSNEFEDRVWLVNGVHKLCLYHAWRRGKSPALQIESITQIRGRHLHEVKS